MSEVEVNRGGDLLRSQLGPKDTAVVRMHRRGHHVQKAHGRRVSLATEDSHLSGGMIALMPTAADAKRIALPGGEKAADLHCTLFFLGDDGSVWTEEQRDELEALVRSYVQGLGPVQANIFGVAHWNGNGEKPSWVWSTGDNPEADSVNGLQAAQLSVLNALESTHDRPEVPPQHTPWAAHICAAYTDDLTLVRALEKRLGPVTFDRIRLSFGDDDRDIPLTGSLTASALRRDVLDHEADTDFAEHNRQWENAVASADGRLLQVFSTWRAGIREQITAGIDTPEELTGLAADPDRAAEILSEAMLDLAHRAGQSLARQAEKQGVTVPDWSLPDDVVTAAVGGRKLLRSVARMTADLLSTSVLTTVKRTVTGLFAKDASPETIASEVDRALADAQESLLKGPVGTAMSAAQTAGRQAVLQAAPPGEYYASEMLDRNTCAPCRAVDGEQFGSLEIAVKAYPVMGYKDCVGPRYGHSCRGMIVARWTPEEPVTAAGSGLDFHGSPGRPGYELLHGGGRMKNKDLFSPGEEGVLQEDLDEAHFAGFIPHAYSFFTDPGSHDYDPEDKTPEDEINYVHWENLGRYYASGAGDTWFGDFESSRSIRRAANESAGLDQSGHDRLLGEGEVSEHDKVVGTAMLAAVAVSPPVDRPLYRGSFYAGADPDEVEAQLRSTDGLDFSVVSFTDGQGVADYFADPDLYQANHPGGPQGGARVMYEVEPGAQGILGHVFSKDMKAGDPGQNPDEAEYINSDEALTDFTRERPREIVTGGHFQIGEITRDGDTVHVRLKQTKVYRPKAAS
jgi:2'-5' RNA ligase